MLDWFIELGRRILQEEKELEETEPEVTASSPATFHVPESRFQRKLRKDTLKDLRDWRAGHRS